MPRAATKLSAELIGHFNRLEYARLRGEGLSARSEIRRADIELLYSALFLDVVVSFERFLEALFIGQLTGHVIHKSRIVPRVRFQSSAVARDVVLAGRNYVEWIPYDQTMKRAEVFFRNGLPFVGLNAAERLAIEQCVAIRNAIAHKSPHAIKTFEKKLLSGVALVGYERTPSGYLRSAFRANPPQTRYENLVIEVASISRTLTG